MAQALGVYINPTQDLSEDDIREIVEDLNIDPLLILRARQISLEVMFAGVIKRVKAHSKWQVADTHDVEIKARRINQAAKHTVTFAIIREATPRASREDKVTSNVVGKVVLHKPIRKQKGDVIRKDLDSARIRTFVQDPKTLPHIHIQEWELISNYIAEIAERYEESRSGVLSDTQRRAYLTKIMTTMGVVPSAAATLPRIAPLSSQKALEAAVEPLKERGVELFLYDLDNATEVIERTILGPLTIAERLLAKEAERKTSRPVAKQWLKLTAIHNELDQAINKTTPRPWLDHAEASVRAALKDNK